MPCLLLTLKIVGCLVAACFAIFVALLCLDIAAWQRSRKRDGRDEK